MKENNRVVIDHPWAKTTEEVLVVLGSAMTGLSEEVAMKRYSLYGKNAFANKESKSVFAILGAQFTSPLIFILIAAAIVTGILGEWIEVGVIAFAVLVNASLGFYREYHAEHTLEKLATFIKDRTRVVRDGIEIEIDSELVVPGDIVRLSYGSRVPADMRIIRAFSIKLDESILTGESVPVAKTETPVPVTAIVAERINMVHAGTLVVDGSALAVVVATGNRTEIGKIASLVSNTRRAKTPIQKGLSKIAWIIFALVVVLVVSIFVLGVTRGESILTMLVLSAAVAVSAVPEALPMALTVILSIGAERIAKKRGIARTLMAAETLGSASLIMTDKTGTLTEANMRLVSMYQLEDIVSDTAADALSESKELLAMAIGNIDVIIENPEAHTAEWVFKGKPFEVNIAKAARDAGIDVSRFRAGQPSPIVVPFNSTHKLSVSSSDGMHVVMGAPDILLSLSDSTAKTYSAVESWIAKKSEEGGRLIALATMTTPVTRAVDVQNIQFAGVLVFHDPVRAEVPAAIAHIEALGAKIVMVTGDLPGTARSVASVLGWEVEQSAILTGRDLQALKDDELLAILPSVKIFARVTPEDKLRIGTLYQKLGEVVAMTGDGVNDAPSLKAVDIGIALGSGSDVAKSAADLVLLDDNFQTISHSMQEGRRILVNIRKTFVYLMSNSLDQVFVIGGSLMLGIPLPTSALQIIWVNLFTGSLPALAFAYDEDFDHVAPKNRTLKSIFTREVNLLTFGIGAVSSLLLFVMYALLLHYGVALPLARSVFFVCFSSYILVAAYSFRSLRKPLFSYPLFSNKKLNQAVLIAFGLIIATMTLPVFRELFGLAAIPLLWLLFVLGWLVLNVLLVEGAKYVFRRERFRA
ncbi:MAG: HAD-IC family P-type ATPase [Candidatus Pacebacteria bacterium]|jgi:Ca2+-transporting ATPase|nr:HAD-IC family P-type ATPase [Candidatus Paceibacterota bacterium]